MTRQDWLDGPYGSTRNMIWNMLNVLLAPLGIYAGPKARCRVILCYMALQPGWLHTFSKKVRQRWPGLA